jgi:hypothetical protein
MKSLTRAVDWGPKLVQRHGLRRAQSLKGINLVTNPGIYPALCKGRPPAEYMEERGGFWTNSIALGDLWW